MGWPHIEPLELPYVGYFWYWSSRDLYRLIIAATQAASAKKAQCLQRMPAPAGTACGTTRKQNGSDDYIICCMVNIPSHRHRALLSMLTTFALMCAGCSKPDAPPPPPSAADLDRRPADAKLAALYERSCASCHARVGAGAPLAGDQAAWAPRLAKGKAALLQSAQQGLNAMPPMGLCPDCSADDLSALIDFMTQPAGGRP